MGSRGFGESDGKIKVKILGDQDVLTLVWKN